MSSFSNLHKRIIDKNEFKIRLLSFLNQVIRYKLTLEDTNQILPEIGPQASATNNTSIFTLKLKDDVNLIASQV